MLPDFHFFYLWRTWLVVLLGALVISAPAPKAVARIEYAADMRTIAELATPGEEMSLASEVRAKMRDVSQMSDETSGEIVEPISDVPQAIGEAIDPDSPIAIQKTQGASGLQDSPGLQEASGPQAATPVPEADGEPSASADPNLGEGAEASQAVFTLALDEVSGESVGLFFADSRLERRISFKKELEGRQAHGYISREAAAEVEAELLRNAGVHYRVPRDEQELMSTLGFAPDTPVSREDLRDLLTVHLQVALGFQPETSAYLARVVWILTSSRGWPGK